MRNLHVLNLGIAEIYENEFMMDKLPIDEFETVGKQALLEKIGSFTANNKPIEFVMLGYPFKSPNHINKTLSSNADLGEELSIKRIVSFTSKIKELYDPGAMFNIASDGYSFNDLLGVEDSILEYYRECCLAFGDASFNIYTMRHFFSSTSSINTMREKIDKEFSISEEEMQKRILFNPNTNILYRGMIRFMEEELAIKEFPSRNQLNKAAKLLTREMMLRNESWSNFVKKEFASNIRMSMHHSTNNGEKFSFDLIKKARHSPWHSVIGLEEGKDPITMHKREAIENGWQLNKTHFIR